MTSAKRSTEYHKKFREAHALIVTRQGAEAIELAEELRREAPDDPGAYFLLGLYAFSQNNFGDAIKLFNAAHERDPECREYSDCLAILYTVTGKLSDGLYFAKLSTALESDPDVRPFIPNQLSNYFEAFDRIEPSRHYVSALLLYNNGKFEDAIRSCELALSEDERHEQSHALLGLSHLRIGNYEKAASALHAAIHLNPHAAGHASVLGSALCHLGRFEEAIVCHKTALARDPSSIEHATSALLDAEGLPDSFDTVRVDLRRELDSRIAAQPASGVDFDRDRGPGGRLHVAYISNALYDTEQARFISALLAHHDHGRFQIFCYQQSIAKDSVHVQLQNYSDSWREVFDVQDPIMEMIINGDRIDVLVDLCGYTRDNRAAVIAHHPAPVQIALLEPPYGIGAHGIDLVISDPVTHAADRAAIGEDQVSVRIEHGLFALEPFTFFPEVDALPAASSGRLTFGGHCDLARLTPETAALWSSVLMASGPSKLVLGDVPALSGALKNHVIDLFGHFGVADRIIFWDDQPEDHLGIEFFRHIDVLLDSYPLNGRMDICKALWMGVPVLSLKGPRRVSQIGASILNSAGAAEWICDSPEQMSARAASFAADLNGLAKARSRLRDKIAESDLFAPQRLTVLLEGIYLSAADLRRRAAAAAAKPKRRGTGRRKKTPATRKSAGAKRTRKNASGGPKSSAARRKRRR